MKMNPDIMREIESLESVSSFVSKYELNTDGLITYGQVDVNDYIYEMNDLTGIAKELIYSITEEKRQDQFAFEADIDNDGEIELIIWHEKDDDTTITLLKDVGGTFKKNIILFKSNLFLTVLLFSDL